MVRRACNLHGFDTHLFKVTQAIDPAARCPDLFTVIPRGLKLAELPADHLVAGSLVACDIDAAHKSPSAGISLDGNVNTIAAAVYRGFGLSRCKGKAKVRKIIREGLGRLRYVVGVVGLAGLDLDERLEFILLLQIVALHADPGDNKALALGDIDGDHNFLLIGRDRHLRGVDLELQVAFGQVIRTECLHVRIQFAADIAIGFGVPAQPGSRVQVKQIQQRAPGKRLGTDDIDGFNLGGTTFGHRETEIDPVFFKRRNGGDHLRGVHAAVDVLALQLLLRFVRQCLVERAALGDTNVFQCFFEYVCLKFPNPGKIDLRHIGTLLNHHDEHIATGIDSDIVKQTEREQCPDGTGRFFVAVTVANPERQRCKNSPSLHALQAIDTDVFDNKWL